MGESSQGRRNQNRVNSARVIAGTIRVASAKGPHFDCYLASPDTASRVPAVVLASTVAGVDEDLRRIAEQLASHGYIAAAPDLFWRTMPGPLVRTDPRRASRAQPRLEKIKTGEQDLLDVLQELHRRPRFNGRAAVMGFCYGGPYAVLGPKRLGYHAGVSCHGSQLLDYMSEIEGIDRPVRLLWGDRDHLAPENVRRAYQAVSQRNENVTVYVLPGIQHGYMMQGSVGAFSRTAFDFSLECALALLESLRSELPSGTG